jgi:hypothetical protein
MSHENLWASTVRQRYPPYRGTIAPLFVIYVYNFCDLTTEFRI